MHTIDHYYIWKILEICLVIYEYYYIIYYRSTTVGLAQSCTLGDLTMTWDNAINLESWDDLWQGLPHLM